MKQECPYELNTIAGQCPLQVHTYLPPQTDMDHLKSFFTSFVDRDLWQLTNVSARQIVMLLEDPKFQSRSFDEKCNAVTDLFVQGLLEKRENTNRDNGAVTTLAAVWEQRERQRELTDAQARRAMVESMSKGSRRSVLADQGSTATGQPSSDPGNHGAR